MVNNDTNNYGIYLYAYSSRISTPDADLANEALFAFALGLFDRDSATAPKSLAAVLGLIKSHVVTQG